MTEISHLPLNCVNWCLIFKGQCHLHNATVFLVFLSKKVLRKWFDFLSYTGWNLYSPTTTTSTLARALDEPENARHSYFPASCWRTLRNRSIFELNVLTLVKGRRSFEPSFLHKIWAAFPSISQWISPFLPKRRVWDVRWAAPTFSDTSKKTISSYVNNFHSPKETGLPISHLEWHQENASCQYWLPGVLTVTIKSHENAAEQ